MWDFYLQRRWAISQESTIFLRFVVKVRLERVHKLSGALEKIQPAFETKLA